MLFLRAKDLKYRYRLKMIWGSIILLLRGGVGGNFQASRNVIFQVETMKSEKFSKLTIPERSHSSQEENNEENIIN